jgi:hypothetical protein
MSAIQDTVRVTVEPLKKDGANWTAWRRRIRYVFQEKGLWKVVNEGIVAATAEEDKPTPEAKLAEAQKKDRKALSLMCQHIADAVLLDLGDVESACDGWTKLSRLFDQPSKATILSKKIQFLSTKMDASPKADMREHLRTMAKLVEELKEAGQLISEQDLILQLLMSLPASYSTLVTGLQLNSGWTPCPSLSYGNTYSSNGASVPSIPMMPRYPRTRCCRCRCRQRRRRRTVRIRRDRSTANAGIVRKQATAPLTVAARRNRARTSRKASSSQSRARVASMRFSWFSLMQQHRQASTNQQRAETTGSLTLARPHMSPAIRIHLVYGTQGQYRWDERHTAKW